MPKKRASHLEASKPSWTFVSRLSYTPTHPLAHTYPPRTHTLKHCPPTHTRTRLRGPSSSLDLSAICSDESHYDRDGAGDEDDCGDSRTHHVSHIHYAPLLLLPRFWGQMAAVAFELGVKKL